MLGLPSSRAMESAFATVATGDVDVPAALSLPSGETKMPMASCNTHPSSFGALFDAHPSTTNVPSDASPASSALSCEPSLVVVPSFRSLAASAPEDAQSRVSSQVGELHPAHAASNAAGADRSARVRNRRRITILSEAKLDLDVTAAGSGRHEAGSRARRSAGRPQEISDTRADRERCRADEEPGR